MGVDTRVDGSVLEQVTSSTIGAICCGQRQVNATKNWLIILINLNVFAVIFHRHECYHAAMATANEAHKDFLVQLLSKGLLLS